VPHLPKEKFSKLSPAGQRAWSLLPAEVKRLVLTPTVVNTPPHHNINVHDYVDSNAPEVSHVEVDGSTSLLPEDSSDSLLVNVTQQKPHPADICRMLSTSASSPSKSSQKPSSPSKATQANEVVIDDVTYRQVNVHTTYNASTLSVQHSESLVD
jgi:hypothetical protein